MDGIELEMIEKQRISNSQSHAAIIRPNSCFPEPSRDFLAQFIFNILESLHKVRILSEFLEVLKLSSGPEGIPNGQSNKSCNCTLLPLTHL